MTFATLEQARRNVLAVNADAPDMRVLDALAVAGLLAPASAITCPLEPRSRHG